MRDLAVVALEEVLAADLPVRLVLGVRALRKRSESSVEPGGGEELAAARRASRASGAASGSGLTKTNGPQVSTRTGRGRARRASKLRPRGRRAAPSAASRRARTSRRGTGTGASRACPRPRRRASRGGGRRSGTRAARLPCRGRRRSGSPPASHVKNEPGSADLVGAARRTARCGGRSARARAAAPPDRCTSRRESCGRRRSSPWPESRRATRPGSAPATKQ